MVVGWVGARAVDRGRGKSTDEEGVCRLCIKHVPRGREIDGTKKRRAREGRTRRGRGWERRWKEEGERKRKSERARGSKMRENKGKRERKRKKGREKTDAARWVRTYYYTSLQSYL